MLRVAILLFVAAVANANIGSCPNPDIQKDFDLEKFAGTWYVIEHGTTSPIPDVATRPRCSRYKIEFRDKGKAGVLNKYYTTLGIEKSDYSDVTTPKSSEPGKLLISPLKGSFLGRKQTVAILETDYTDYAITFSCKSVLFTNHQEVTILSRTKEMNDKKKMDIYDLLNKQNVSQKNLKKMDQKHEDCEKLEEKEEKTSTLAATTTEAPAK